MLAHLLRWSVESPAKYWWFRSPNHGLASSVRVCTASGAFDGTNARNSNSLVVACTICGLVCSPVSSHEYYVRFCHASGPLGPTSANNSCPLAVVECPAKYWWFRSPYPGDAYVVRSCYTSGAFNGSHALISSSLVVACTICG